MNGWKDTRSAFGGTFERLIEFQAPDTAPFYMHFGLCFGDHPLLIMGSTTGKTYLWDLAMIERFGVSTADSNHNSPVPAGAQRDILDERLDVLTPPHRTLETAKIRSPIRSFAFSPDDQYIVQVGESSVIAILKR